MKKRRMKKRIDWIDGIIILIMIICVVVLSQYYYNVKTNRCLLNPIGYGIDQLEDKYGYPIIVYGIFISDKPLPIISFTNNSTKVTYNR